MAKRKLDLVQNHQISDGFQGNANTAILLVKIKNGDEVGDVLESPRLPGGLVYTSIEVCSEGNTAGLEIDLGWQGAGEHRAVLGNLKRFADGMTVEPTGRVELLNKSYPMSNGQSRQVSHEMAITLGGVLTVDEVVEIHLNFIDNGRL